MKNTKTLADVIREVAKARRAELSAPKATGHVVALNRTRYTRAEHESMTDFMGR